MRLLLSIDGIIISLGILAEVLSSIVRNGTPNGMMLVFAGLGAIVFNIVFGKRVVKFYEAKTK